MTPLPIGSKSRLPADTLFTLAHHAGQSIEVRHGAVWITRPDEPRDIVLEAGGILEIHDPRGMIVGAINGAAEVSTGVTWSHARAA